ncbi:MAG TPA: reverse transcriptase/maturase family protein, partial [Thermomicrobiales bacterium]|nr:reverse transcriptase/maturase family protein [Thermomicrobiales bacterium]
KTRRIALICLRDRVLQRAVLDRLGPHCEARFLPSSFGYRTGLSLHDAVDRIVRLRNRGLTIVIDADIRNCFDNLDHAIMRAALFRMIPHLDAGLASLIDLWIAMPPQQRSRRQAGLAPAKRTRGVLQGAPISPLLCNIYLHQLDDALARRRLSLTRYADDFVVLCPTIDHAMTALIAIQQVLGDIGLECHPRKTRITTFDEGFAFLGVEFKGTDYTYEVEGKRIRIDTFPPGWFHYLAEGYDG